MSTATENRVRDEASSQYELFRDSEGQLSACSAIGQFWREYSRERPEVVALWCFGIGFVLGWKLKPW